MKTNVANAPNTNSTRLRIAGTSSAARRLLSTYVFALSFTRRTCRSGLFEGRARRRQRFTRAIGEQDVAETKAGRYRFACFAAAENFDAVALVLDLLCNLERLRRYFDRRIPVREIVEIDDRRLRAEMP